MLQRHCLIVTMVAACSWSVRADVVFVDAANCPGPGDGSELDPYCSIQTAIDNAVDTDEIVVAPGTYFETVNFLGKAITLRSSDGADVTSIDAQGSGSVVTCDSGEGPDTVLQGFTITGGAGTVGGGMRNHDSDPTVTGCTFSGNTAGNGGAMYNANSSPTVTNCTFSGNSASSFGGGIHTRNYLHTNSSPTVTGCTFIGNSAAIEGGGMYNDGVNNPTVTGCTFEGNIAARGGGMLNRDRTTVIDCLFIGNTATGDTQNGRGGGIYDSSRPIITNCTFVGNHASSGGGMEINKFGGSNVVIPVADCTFITNTADDRGGGLYLRVSQPNGVTVTNCIFNGNAARNKGGGMFNDSGTPVVTNCTVAGNTAAEGGGMYNSFSRPTMTNCVFASNSATSLGGGIFGLWFNNSTVTNCTFSGNTAESSGGAMYYLGSNARLVNCSFDGNSAAVDGGTLRSDTHISSFPSSPTLVNCVVWDSSSDPFAQDELSTITVLYSDIAGSWPGTGNIDVDPMFVDPAGGDLRLMQGSPCIDAGHNWAIADLTDTDLDGSPRFADDPATDDTGCGVPVIVDMGAYELPGVAAEIVVADVNGDGFVGVADLMIVNACIGSSDPDCCIADVVFDGIVGPADRALVRSAMVQGRPAGLFGADCNHNGLADVIDIQFGTSLDCNGNAVPDECDIDGSQSFDCNGNAVPDECDIAQGTSLDRNGDGVPDECEPVPNDTCEDAIVISEGPTPFHTHGANTDGFPASCVGFQTFHNDIWFLYTPSFTGIATFSVCNDADFDTLLAVYFAGNCPPSLNPLACSDNAPDCGQTSELQQLVVAGIPYLVRVGGTEGAGVGTLTISCGLVRPTPDLLQVRQDQH